MRVTFARDGGFAAIPAHAKSIAIDTDRLSPDGVARLHALLDGAEFCKQPARVSTLRPGAADFYSYTISVETPDCTRTVQIDGPVTHPGLQRLIAYLEDQVRESREPGQL
jgi:hypothetical protein